MMCVIYTWTCADCPVWAEAYWPTSPEANRDADARESEHRAVCPGNARLTVIGRPELSYPEKLGAERLIGTYDPNEPMLVPAWAVLVARSVLAVIARQLSQGARIDLTNPDEIWFWATNFTAADPLPDQPRPTTASELERLLKKAARTLSSSLPNPF